MNPTALHHATPTPLDLARQNVRDQYPTPAWVVAELVRHIDRLEARNATHAA